MQRRLRVLLVVAGLGMTLTFLFKLPGSLPRISALDQRSPGVRPETQVATGVLRPSKPSPPPRLPSKDASQPAHGNAQGRRYLLYNCDDSGWCGGWADRIKGMVAGYLIAMATNRTFAINITDWPCPLTDFLRPNKVRWDALPSEEELRGVESQKYNAIDSDHFFGVLKDEDLDRVFHSPVVQFRANLEYAHSIKANPRYTSGPWKWTTNLTNAQIYASVMEDLFALAPSLQEELDDFLRRARPSPKHRLVCAHMRIGKNPTNPQDLLTRGTPDDVAKVLDFLEKRVQKKAEARVFLASDSEGVRTAAKRRLGARLWLMNGTVAHVERIAKGQDACQALRTVLLEQRVLSRCDVLLLSFSGLGRHAAYLRRRDEDLFCLVRGQILPCTPAQLRALYRVKG